MYTVNLDDIEPKCLDGRDLYWLATPDTIGSKRISFAIMRCHPRAVVRPMHTHKNIEEILYIIRGEGEAWIDGTVYPFRENDAVLLPENSRHQVRNTSDLELVTVSIFSGLTDPESYINYEEDAFAGKRE